MKVSFTKTDWGWKTLLWIVSPWNNCFPFETSFSWDRLRLGWHTCLHSFGITFYKHCLNSRWSLGSGNTFIILISSRCWRAWTTKWCLAWHLNLAEIRKMSLKDSSQFEDITLSIVLEPKHLIGFHSKNEQTLACDPWSETGSIWHQVELHFSPLAATWLDKYEKEEFDPEETLGCYHIAQNLFAFLGLKKQQEQKGQQSLEVYYDLPF